MDVASPRCAYCDEPLDLAEWMERLNAHQAFLDFRRGLGVPGQGVPLPICARCKADPKRAERYLSGMSTEDLRARMRRGVDALRRIEEEEGV